MRARVVVLLAAALLASGACNKRNGADGGATGAAGSRPEPAPSVPFEVRRDSADVTFIWFDDRGAAHAVARVDDVPEASRETVRVDPSRPELRAPGWVYLVDLRAPGPDGRFRVAAVASEQFAQDLAQRNGLAALPSPPAAPPAAAPGGAQPAPGAGNGGAQLARVTIYGASWCGACHQAADYLRANNIPFVEHDIEREPDAARDMYARAREQNVPTGSIPIIDVGGRLMVGFNPEAIQRALRGG